MARLMEVADAARATIEGWFPRSRVKTVEVHAGAFAEEELEQFATATPAIYVCLTSVRDNRNNGAEDTWDAADPSALPVEVPVHLASHARRDVLATFAALVFARPGDVSIEGRRREVPPAGRVAEVVATELLRRIPEQLWGLAGLRGAENVVGRNWFDTRWGQASGRRGRAADGEFPQRDRPQRMAAWDVMWQQWITLGAPWPGDWPDDWFDRLCVTRGEEDPEPVDVPDDGEGG